MYMNFLFVLFVFVLFFILTPGILVTLPKKGSKMVVALVHGVIFATTLAVSKCFFWKSGNSVFEGATDGTTDKVYNRLEALQRLIKGAKKEDISEGKKTILLNKLSAIMVNKKKSTEPELSPEEITQRRKADWQKECPNKTTETITGKDGLPKTVLRCDPNDPPPEYKPKGV